MTTAQQAPGATPDSRPLPTGVQRAVLVSDSPVLMAGMRSLMPERGVQVVAELDGGERVLESVGTNSAQFVIAAPADGGNEELFGVLEALPANCTAIVLLAVPGFRIQANALSNRFDVVCLPLNVGRDAFHAGINEALRGDDAPISVEELCSGVSGTLTPREQQVLLELVQGKSNRAIAESLWLSEDTVKSHLRRIYRKLGVGSRAEAVSLYVGQLGSA
jgi:DNA-binding NarL/FixJ family response regulator